MQLGENFESTLNNSIRNTCNITPPCIAQDFRPFDLLWSIVFAAVAILSEIGNFLVLLVIFKNKTLQTTSNYFIASASITDMLMPIAYLLFVISSRQVGKKSSEETKIFQPTARFILDLSCAVSAQSLVAISVHRFYAVFYPLKARLESFRTCFLIICFNWIIATVLYAPRLYYSSLGINDCLCTNDPLFKIRLIWDASYAVLIVVALAVVIVIYSRIIVHLKKTKIPGVSTSSSLHIARRKRENTRLSVMFIIISLVFFSSWFPFWLSIMLLRYFFVDGNCILEQVHSVISILPGIQTSGNPLLFFTFSTQFRQGLKSIFKFS